MVPGGPLQREQRDAEPSSRILHPRIVAREHHLLPLLAQELDGSEMQRIHRANLYGKEFQCARQHRRCQLEEGEALHISYSINRLLTSVCSQSSAGGDWSSASRCASATDVSA